MHKIIVYLFVISLILINFPKTSFSEQKGAWLYAGPLSDTPKNIQRKADLKKIAESPPAIGAIIAKTSPIVKKEEVSFWTWLQKVFSGDKKIKGS